MRIFSLLILIFLISNCVINIHGTSIDETLSNDIETLGLIGISISSSKPDIATAEITSSAKIKITSVSEGMSIITVSDIEDHNSYINVNVTDTGDIKFGNIVKYSDDTKIRLNRHDLENDMFLPHEGAPAGVPEFYDWKHMPRLGYGINPPDDWNAYAAWGEVYADENLPNPNIDFPLIRVHIKSIQLYVYLDDGSWKILQDVENPVGYLYVEDFIDDVHIPTDIVHEKDGGISISAGSGYNFHFFPDNRAAIVHRNSIRGIFAVCKARLIGAENYISSPGYLMCVGGDYWRDFTSEWKSDWLNNSDIGIGRFKYITPEWQFFAMHTFSKEEVKHVIFPLE